MKIALILITLVILPIINWGYDNIALRLEQESPEVFEEYGGASNFMFAWKFIFLGLYKYENISKELKNYIRHTNLITLITFGVYAFLITLIKKMLF